MVGVIYKIREPLKYEEIICESRSRRWPCCLSPQASSGPEAHGVANYPSIL